MAKNLWYEQLRHDKNRLALKISLTLCKYYLSKQIYMYGH